MGEDVCSLFLLERKAIDGVESTTAKKNQIHTPRWLLWRVLHKRCSDLAQSQDQRPMESEHLCGKLNLIQDRCIERCKTLLPSFDVSSIDRRVWVRIHTFFRENRNGKDDFLLFHGSVSSLTEFFKIHVVLQSSFAFPYYSSVLLCLISKIHSSSCTSHL